MILFMFILLLVSYTVGCTQPQPWWGLRWVGVDSPLSTNLSKQICALDDDDICALGDDDDYDDDDDGIVISVTKTTIIIMIMMMMI